MFLAGSAVAVQQKLHADFEINVYDSVSVPLLPIKNKMMNTYSRVLSEKESLMFEDMELSPAQANTIEEQTRLQSNNNIDIGVLYV